MLFFSKKKIEYIKNIPTSSIHINSIERSEPINVIILAIIENKRSLYLNTYEDSLFEYEVDGVSLFQGDVYKVELELKHDTKISIFYGVISKNKDVFSSTLNIDIQSAFASIIIKELTLIHKILQNINIVRSRNIQTQDKFFLEMANTFFYIGNIQDNNNSFFVPFDGPVVFGNSSITSRIKNVYLRDYINNIDDDERELNYKRKNRANLLAINKRLLEASIHIESIERLHLIKIVVLSIIDLSNNTIIYLNTYDDTIFDIEREGTASFKGCVYKARLSFLSNRTIEIFYGIVNEDKYSNVKFNLLDANTCSDFVIKEISQKYDFIYDLRDFKDAKTQDDLFLEKGKDFFYFTTMSGINTYLLKKHNNLIKYGLRDDVIPFINA